MTVLNPGQEFQADYEVPQTLAQTYAQASGDFNPIHLDAEFAKQMGLKGPILHGLCTLGLLVSRLSGFVGEEARLRQLKLRFSHPVYAGESLRFKAEVKSAATEPQANQSLKAEVKNGQGEPVISNCQVDFGPSPTAPPPPLDQEFDDPIDVAPFQLSDAEIAAYCQATGFPPRTPGQPAPPLLAGISSMRPFFKTFLDPEKIKTTGLQILHGGQEFQFHRSIHPGESLHAQGVQERKSSRKGQEFTYFLTECRNAAGDLMARGRSLVITMPR